MEGMRPDLVAPVVVWLCHESCEENGAVIEAAAGWAGRRTISFQYLHYFLRKASHAFCIHTEVGYLIWLS